MGTAIFTTKLNGTSTGMVVRVRDSVPACANHR
jgi:hypothetical protein